MSLSATIPERKEDPVKRLFLTLSLAVLSPPVASWAEIPAPNTAGVSNGHLHLNVRDVEANTKFFAALGGTPLKDQPGVVEFPDVVVRLREQAPGLTLLGKWRKAPTARSDADAARGPTVGLSRAPVSSSLTS